MTALRVIEASGSDGSIQFADNGDFGASSSLVFVTGTNSLGVGTSSPSANLHVVGSTIFGGSSGDLHQFTGTAVFGDGLSGSLTQLPDGSSYLVAGTNISIVTQSNGQIVISSTGAGTPGGFWFSDEPNKIYTTGSARVGDYGTEHEFRVNGMNLTPYSGSVIVPGGTLTDTEIMSLTGSLLDNQYASLNIDVVGSTKGVTDFTTVSTGKWLMSVSFLRVSGVFQLVGQTELDGHRFRGSSAPDIPQRWDVCVDASGSLFVNTKGTPTDTAWGAVVTKQSILDMSGGFYLG